MSDLLASPRYENLDKYLAKLEVVKKLPKDHPGLYVHAGCGPQVLDGWLNVDKYTQLPGVFNVDMANIPLAENSVKAIYSSHALEHLPIRRARTALLNWGKILEPGGDLYLAIPDLEQICRAMLSDEFSDDAKENWYFYTLFGYQVDPSKYSQSRDLDLPEDPGQFHVSGFTQRSLTKYLAEAGLVVKEMFTYNGWDTLSFFTHARKEPL